MLTQTVPTLMPLGTGVCPFAFGSCLVSEEAPNVVVNKAYNFGSHLVLIRVQATRTTDVALS